MKEGVNHADPLHEDQSSLTMRALTPWNGHRRRLAMAFAAYVFRTVLEPRDESRQLLDRLFVGPPTLLGRCQFRFAEHAHFAVAAGPRDHGRGAGAEEIDPVE